MPSLRVVDAAAQRAVEHVAAALEQLGEQVAAARARLVALGVDQDLRERDRGDVLAALVVDHAHVLVGLEEVGDALERDVAARLGVVELAIRVALDQDGHRPLYASEKSRTLAVGPLGVSPRRGRAPRGGAGLRASRGPLGTLVGVAGGRGRRLFLARRREAGAHLEEHLAHGRGRRAAPTRASGSSRLCASQRAISASSPSASAREHGVAALGRLPGAASAATRSRACASGASRPAARAARPARRAPPRRAARAARRRPRPPRAARARARLGERLGRRAGGAVRSRHGFSWSLAEEPQRDAPPARRGRARRAATPGCAHEAPPQRSLGQRAAPSPRRPARPRQRSRRARRAPPRRRAAAGTRPRAAARTRARARRATPRARPRSAAAALPSGQSAHAIHDDARHVRAVPLEPREQIARVRDGLAARGRGEHEGRVGPEQQLPHAPPRARAEALGHALEGEQELRDVLEEAEARDALDQREAPGARRAGTAAGRAGPALNAGCSSSCTRRLSRKPSRRSGASRKSSACARRRRVEHDQVELGPRARSRRPSPSRSTRRCRRARRRRAGRCGFARMRSRAAAVGREARHQLVEGALHVEHHRGELARRAARRARSSSSRAIGCGSGPSAPTPSASARRRAGSIVSTSTRRPRAPRRAPIAAASGGLADAARADAHDHAACAARPRRTRAPRSRGFSARAAAAASAGEVVRPAHAARRAAEARRRGSPVSSPISLAKRRFSAWRDAQVRRAGGPASAGCGARRRRRQRREPPIEIRQLGREGRGRHRVHDHAIERDARPARARA